MGRCRGKLVPYWIIETGVSEGNGEVTEGYPMKSSLFYFEVG